MRCGISTACFFPEDTLLSLRQVVQTGAPVTEIFLNTFSEIEDIYVEELCRVVRASGIRVVSVHPFSSMLDGFFFASPYASRFQDGLALFRRYYEVCQKLGADKLIFHGDHAHSMHTFSLERYAQHIRVLSELGEAYGVTLCHENVYYCRLGDPKVVREIRPLLGEAAAFVLDTKQVQRCGDGTGIDDMLAAMSQKIRHVHISDYNASRDCLPPGTGQMDFPALIHQLRAFGYEGDLIIELYRDGFADTEELVRAMRYVESLL